MARTSDWPDTLTPAAVHILLALADGDRHGIGIVEEVERRSRGDVKLGPGTLYGTIKRLREAEFIEESDDPGDGAEPDPRRRYYRMTAAGKRALRTEVERLDLVVRTARLKAVLGTAEER